MKKDNGTAMDRNSLNQSVTESDWKKVQPQLELWTHDECGTEDKGDEEKVCLEGMMEDSGAPSTLLSSTSRSFSGASSSSPSAAASARSSSESSSSSICSSTSTSQRRHKAPSHSQSNVSSTTRNDRTDDEERSRQRNRSIRMLKLTVIALLAFVGALGSILTFHHLQSRDRQNFDAALERHATRLLEAIYVVTDKRTSAASQTSIAYSSFAKYTGQEWPNVTLPDFQAHATIPVYQAQASWMAFSPLIRTEDERLQFEAYAASQTPRNVTGRVRSKNGGRAKKESEKEKKEENRDCKFNRTISDGIHRKDGDKYVDDVGIGPIYSPLWQIAPSKMEHKSLMMLNVYREEACRKAVDSMIAFKSVILSQTVWTPPSKSPISYMMVPIFQSLDSDDTVVGSITLRISWMAYFSDVLSDRNKEGDLYMVLKNTCGDVHTFRTEGTNAIYLGPEDLHDPAFDDYMHESEPEAFHYLCSNVPFQGNYINGYERFAGNSSYNTDEDSPQVCFYSVQIYPTASYADQFHTQRPVRGAFTVAMMLVFAVVVFVIYDCLVEKRQERVMETAVKANAIVQSLFPESVRERLFGAKAYQPEPANMSTSPRTKKYRIVDTPKLRLKSFLANHQNNSQNNSANGGGGDSNGSYQSHGSRGIRRHHQNHPASSQASPRVGMLQSRGRAMLSDLGSLRNEPIADLFPHTTIMFADIAGFTAWSSEREPYQVFQLLETLYEAFDREAKRLGVFKVETIGDCYVAVAGLPDPNEDHAIIMAKFASECLRLMGGLTTELEVLLGPGTADLGIRFGLHSGAVTAGVLRGEKSRFQLFGDTVNTAARMEGTGEPNRIQVSQTTADLLVLAGRHHWLTPRDGVVPVKGKGEMHTHWLTVRRAPVPTLPGLVPASSEPSLALSATTTPSLPTQHTAPVKGVPPTTSVDENKSWSSGATNSQQWGLLDVHGDASCIGGSVASSSHAQSMKNNLLIDWNVEVLLTLLEKVIQHRREGDKRRPSASSLQLSKSMNGTIIDEVSEIIDFPPYSRKDFRSSDSASRRRIGEDVKAKLKDYVRTIATLYRDVPFHNFEHASHVTMSANKLMKRIITPRDELVANSSRPKTQRARIQAFNSDHHASTFGISSDPLTQFAIVFSALIHDVDHTGLPNAQLVVEGHDIATKYNNKSVAEQNSVDIAWNLLMEPQYRALRQCIFGNEKERARFRQLVVNSVMATDIVDKELKQLRNNRWDKAFDETQLSEPPTPLDVNRKATIVIEHIIQASDVAHTMQHWHIYCKWNQKLFYEMYHAYLTGRASKDPSVGWYEGEIWFFDNYTIPLAKKLKECGVFGVSSDEYLSYALENRKEWEAKGREETQKMIQRYRERSFKMSG